MATKIGGEGPDRIDGGGLFNAADDSIEGRGGNDTLLGQAGDDTLLGGDGDDSLSGGAGDDSILGGDGKDILEAAAGSDRLFGEAGADRLFGNVDGATASLFGGDGDDDIRAFFNDVAHGDAGNDVITVQFSSAAVTVFGDAGNDRIVGDETDNRFLDGGDGNDTILGNGGNDSLVGSAGSDSLDGGDGDDTLAAGPGGPDGPDSLLGLAGNDSILGGADADFIDGGTGEDRLFGAAGRDVMRGGDGNDTALGGLDDDTMSGGSGSDLLLGDVGSDSIDGEAGDDSLDGAGGNDTLLGGDGDDDLSGGTGTDRLVAGAGRNTLSGGDDDDELDARGAEFASLVGGAGNDLLIADGDDAGGGLARHQIVGGEGFDTYKLVGEGDVDIDLGNPRNLIVGGTGDVLDGIEGVDLTERVGNHRVRYGNADDLVELDISSGAQTRDGGVGTDVTRLSGFAEGSTLAIDIDAGLLVVDGQVQDDRIIGFEGVETEVSAVVLIGAGAADNLIGTSGPTARFLGGSVVSGGFGNDTVKALVEGAVTISGGLGDDLVALNRVEPGAAKPDAKGTVIDGGAGDDALGYDGAFAAVTGGAGVDTLLVGPEGLGAAAVNLDNASDQTSGDTVVAKGLENVDASQSLKAVRLAGSSGTNRLIGSNDLAAGDVISGRGGNDFIDGGRGVDTLSGGDGNDVIVLGANTTLIDGGRGRDTLIVTDDNVVVDLTNPNPQVVAGRVITLRNVEVVDSTGLAAGQSMGATGTDADDIFRGGAGDDTYRGGKGNDTVEGAGGFNELDGGDGFDVLLFRGDLDLKVSLKAIDDGSDNLKQTDGLGNSLKNFEGVDASLLSLKIELKGDDGANLLAAGSGSDVIDSGLGRDTVRGGGGDDVIVYRAGASVIDGGLGSGDTLKVVETAGLKAFNLGASDQSGGDDAAIRGFEVLDGSGSGARLVVTGSLKADQVLGGAGDDLLSGRSGDDRLFGGTGRDLLSGGDGKDTIEGGEGGDVIDGGAGNDHLIAEALGDTLTGGTGADLFEVRGGGTGGTTVIRDFDRLQGDRLVLAGAQDVVFLGSGDFTGSGLKAEIRVTYDAELRATKIELDSDADRQADRTIVVSSVAEVQGDDFLAAAASFATPAQPVAATPAQRPAAIDVEVNGGNGNDRVKGGGGLDTLRGGDGDDTIEALGRELELDGGTGRDTLKLKGVTSRIDLSLGDDQDLGPTLVRLFEDVDATLSRVGVDLKGSSEANRLVGSLKSDTLDGGDDALAGDELLGGGGTDRLFARVGAKLIDGGDGRDTLVVLDGISVDLSTATGSIAGRDTVLRSVEAIDAMLASAAVNLKGSAIANLLIGSGHGDAITGGGGSDTVEGGGGIDTLDGGDGFDVLFFRGDLELKVNLKAELDSLGNLKQADGLGNSLKNFEGIDATLVTRQIELKGDDAANLLAAGTGDDLIDGGLGRDTVRGGDGDDVIVYRAGAVLIDGGLGGGDTLKIVDSAGLKSFGLVAADQSGLGDGARVIGFEHVDGSESGARLVLAGSSAGNRLVGGSAADAISGGKGDDTLIGGLGRDTLSGGDGNDRLLLDVIEDRATGGKGADVFVFDRFGDPAVGAAQARVLDFRAAEGDRIDLSALHDDVVADGITGAIGAFDFLTSADQFSAAGQVRVTIKDTSVGKRIGSTGLIEINLDEDADADVVILVDNVQALRADQFIL